MTETTLADRLRSEGVCCRGFGYMPKTVAFDRELTITSKSIYGYFASFAGGGGVSFPGYKKIVGDLRLTYDTYYKHLQPLIDKGYLRVDKHRTDTGFGRNTYTLCSNPKGITDVSLGRDEVTEGKLQSLIRGSGILANGYGLSPKAVMQDTRIDVKAKGLYLFLSSLTGAGDSAFPKRDAILFYLNISRPTYYKCINQLIALNYITVVQRCESGRMGVNDYYINSNPDESIVRIEEGDDLTINAVSKNSEAQNQEEGNNPLHLKDLKYDTSSNASNYFAPDLSKNSEAGISEAGNSEAQFSKAEKSKERFSRAENSGDNNNTLFNNNSSIIINPSINSSVGSSDRSMSAKEWILSQGQIPRSVSDDVELATEVVHVLTDWGVFYPNGYSNQFDQAVYNLFNQALIEMITATRPMSLKGQLVTAAQVVDKLNEVSSFEEDYVDISSFFDVAFDNYAKAARAGDIKNPLGYMKTVIYQAMLTGNVSWLAFVERLNNHKQ